MEYATIDDVTILFRKLTPEETERAKALIPIVCADLRTYAKTVGKDLDAMVQADQDLAAVAKSVTVDVVGRTLMTSTTGEPMTQMSESAGGYSASGTFLFPAGACLSKNRNWRAWGCAASSSG